MIKEISYSTFGRDGHDTGNSARDPRHPEVPGALHRLAEMDGEKPAKKKFKKYPIGYFHIDIAEVRTEEGQLSLFVAIDRTSKFAYAELHEQNRVRAKFQLAILPSWVYIGSTVKGRAFMPTGHTGESKELRINMRIDAERKAVIARAAHIRHTTISDFVLENAYDAAREIVADETQITLTKKQFAHLCKVLDTPPTEHVKKMRKLLTSKTVLD